MSMLDNQKGFSLVELMIAMFLLMIGFLGVITVLWSSSKAGSFSRNMTTAANLNQDIMERFSTLNYSDLPVTAGFVDCTYSNPVSTGFTRQTRVVENGAGDTKTIMVRIGWNEHGSVKSRTFTVIKRSDF